MSKLSTKNFYLIGPEIKEIVTASFPSRRQVLSLFCHCHNELKKKKLNSAHFVILEVYKFYSNIDIPIMTSLNAVQKLISLHENWTNLKNSKARDATTLSPEMTILRYVRRHF